MFLPEGPPVEPEIPPSTLKTSLTAQKIPVCQLQNTPCGAHNHKAAGKPMWETLQLLCNQPQLALGRRHNSIPARPSPDFFFRELPTLSSLRKQGNLPRNILQCISRPSQLSFTPMHSRTISVSHQLLIPFKAIKHLFTSDCLWKYVNSNHG